jgi:hypothetical protein
VPITVSVATRLSVPDALELTDRKDEDTSAARTLLDRSRDPELRLLGEWAQRLDSSYAPPGPGPDKGQDVVHLIVMDPDDQGSQSSAADCRVALDLRRGRANRR